MQEFGFALYFPYILSKIIFWLIVCSSNSCLNIFKAVSFNGKTNVEKNWFFVSIHKLTFIFICSPFTQIIY